MPNKRTCYWLLLVVYGCYTSVENTIRASVLTNDIQKSTTVDNTIRASFLNESRAAFRQLT